MKKKIYIILMSAIIVCTFGFVRTMAEEDISNDTPQTIAIDDVSIDGSNFPDAAFMNLVKTYDSNKDNILSLSERNAVTLLDAGNKGISNLQGVEYFTKITSFYCPLNKITSLDLSNNKLLKEIYCNRNSITNLNIQGLINLEKLDCYNNQISSLDLSNFAKLVQFIAYDNPNLSSVNLTNCNALQEVQVSNCNLSSLVLPPNATGLRKIGASNNNLSDLNIQNYPSLTDLYVSQNPMAAIDVSDKTLLETLMCFETNISSLVLTNSPKLRNFQCYSTELISLDISNNPLLTSMLCHNSKISNIIFPSSSSTLKGILCDRNALSKLNLPAYMLSYSDNEENKFNTNASTGAPTTQVINAPLVQSGSNYLFDLGALVGMGDLDKVTMSDGSTINMTTGKVTYTSLPTTSTYSYDTGGRTTSGKPLLMNVTVNLEVPVLPSYTVVFKDYDGTVLDTQSILEGGKATAPTSPNRNGYTFEGWDITFENVRTDLQVEAQYSLNTYKIFYRLNTGTNDPSNPSTYTVESETIRLKAPSRKGFIFLGWTFDGVVDPVQDVEIVKGSTGDKNFMAIWDFEKYTVNFETSGGNEIASKLVDYGAIVTKPETPVKEGYSFLGWYKDVDLNEPWDFQKNTVSKNMTLYAKWLKHEEESYIIGIENNEIHIAGDDISFEAIGYGLDNLNPKVDDVRFVPFSWSINPSGVWNNAPYTADFQITKPGEYLLKVIFHKEVFDGSDWVYTGENNLKTSKVIIKEKSEIVKPDDKSPIIETGDSENKSYFILLIIISLLFINRTVSLYRRK